MAINNSGKIKTTDFHQFIIITFVNSGQYFVAVSPLLDFSPLPFICHASQFINPKLAVDDVVFVAVVINLVTITGCNFGGISASSQKESERERERGGEEERGFCNLWTTHIFAIWESFLFWYVKPHPFITVLCVYQPLICSKLRPSPLLLPQFENLYSLAFSYRPVTFRGVDEHRKRIGEKN